MGNKQVVAIFDFDGTLTKGDTLIPFLFHCFGTTKAIIGLLLTSPYILGYTLKLISNNTAKAKVIKHFFKNKRVTFLNQQAESFVQNKIDARLRDNVVKRLRWHQNNDHTSVLLSASLELYIKLWGMKMGFDYIEGTRLTQENGACTGDICGDNCYGKEKVSRVRHLLHDRSCMEVYGYGDSVGDKDFLDLCDYQYGKSELRCL